MVSGCAATRAVNGAGGCTHNVSLTTAVVKASHRQRHSARTPRNASDGAAASQTPTPTWSRWFHAPASTGVIRSSRGSRCRQLFPGLSRAHEQRPSCPRRRGSARRCAMKRHDDVVDLGVGGRVQARLVMRPTDTVRSARSTALKHQDSTTARTAGPSAGPPQVVDPEYDMTITSASATAPSTSQTDGQPAMYASYARVEFSIIGT